MAVVFGSAVIFSLIISINLSIFNSKEIVPFTAIEGFLIGFFWASFTIACISLFRNRPIKYVLTNDDFMSIRPTI